VSVVRFRPRAPFKSNRSNMLAVIRYRQRQRLMSLGVIWVPIGKSPIDQTHGLI
jgi:hypothetical protein